MKRAAPTRSRQHMLALPGKLKFPMTTGSFEDVEFIDVACMICGSTEGHPAGSVTSHGARFDYKICTSCGLKYMNPRPSEAWYAAHYGNQFWEYKQANRSWRDADRKWRLRDLWRKESKGRMRRQAKRLAILVPLIRQHAKINSTSKVLDIGCAYGAIGSGLHEAFGCEMWGVEPNATARAIAASENGIRILAEQAEELITLDTEKGGFDLILLSNVLENILDPVPILKACARLLAPQGVVCIHTPDFYFYDAMNPYHPYIYSADTLQQLLAKSGLEVFAEDQAPTASRRNLAARPVKRGDLFATSFAREGNQVSPVQRTIDPSAMIAEQAATLDMFNKAIAAAKSPLKRAIRKLTSG